MCRRQGLDCPSHFVKGPGTVVVPNLPFLAVGRNEEEMVKSSDLL
jgi:hypothetical protein